MSDGPFDQVVYVGTGYKPDPAAMQPKAPRCTCPEPDYSKAGEHEWAFREIWRMFVHHRIVAHAQGRAAHVGPCAT